MMRKYLAVLCLSLLAPAAAQAAVWEFGALLSPDQEVPAATSPGSGEALLLFDDLTGDFTWSVLFRDLTSPVGGAGPTAHIHEAPAGVNGPVRIFLDSSNPGTVIDGTGKTEGIFFGATTLDAALQTALFAGNLYINIHTTNFAGGEIRGQILPGRVTIVPLPAGVWLMASALTLLAMRRRRG